MQRSPSPEVGQEFPRRTSAATDRGSKVELVRGKRGEERGGSRETAGSFCATEQRPDGPGTAPSPPSWSGRSMTRVHCLARDVQCATCGLFPRPPT